MKETEAKPVIVEALKGIDQTKQEEQASFHLLDGVMPDQVGRLARVPGKRLMEKRDTAVRGIYQFWTAFGYSARVTQTLGGIISEPEDPPETQIKIPIVDFPLNCRPVKAYSNALKVQYIHRLVDFLWIKCIWNRCAGTDMDFRLSLVGCSIAGVPVFDGSVKQAIVGYFTDGVVNTFTHAGKNLIFYGGDTVHGQEEFLIDLSKFRELAGNVAFTLKFKLVGYAFGYLGSGNVLTQFLPEDIFKVGTFAQNGSTFVFSKTKHLTRRSTKANVVTNTSTPTLTTGDTICYIHVTFNPKNLATKDRVWTDDV